MEEAGVVEGEEVAEVFLHFKLSESLQKPANHLYILIFSRLMQAILIFVIQLMKIGGKLLQKLQQSEAIEFGGEKSRVFPFAVQMIDIGVQLKENLAGILTSVDNRLLKKTPLISANVIHTKAVLVE